MWGTTAGSVHASLEKSQVEDSHGETGEPAALGHSPLSEEAFADVAIKDEVALVGRHGPRPGTQQARRETETQAGFEDGLPGEGVKGLGDVHDDSPLRFPSREGKVKHGLQVVGDVVDSPPWDTCNSNGYEWAEPAEGLFGAYAGPASIDLAEDLGGSGLGSCEGRGHLGQ